MTLQTYLNSKPLYYKEIDHKRVHHAYAILKPHIILPLVVHIVGTNGKGSTGRVVAHLAYKGGKSVGHFSSPHILKFNERIWMNGEESSDEILEEGHQKLFTVLGHIISDTLSYFEYTTLLSLVVFEKCDLIVLEAGLGGEFDATNICDKALSIITPIGIDHQDFLGETIEEIASTKIKSIQKKMLIAPQIYKEVFSIARDICKEKKAKCIEVEIKENPFLTQMAHKKQWGGYLIENAQVAMQALDILEIDYNREDLDDLELFGRFYLLTKNIRIDVGHNPLGAMAIEKALRHKVVLIYNSLEDKAYKEVLEILKPKIKRVEIIKIDSQRATTLTQIEEALKEVGLEYSYFKDEVAEDEKYLVFGSFYVVEAFLKHYSI